MQKIAIYDYEAEKIDKLTDEFDMTPAELIEFMFELIDNANIKLEEELAY